jgi:hypothetical protein
METLLVERRSLRQPGAINATTIETEHLVRQAIVLQTAVGTRGAVEYMKAHQIHGAVIGRVLSGGAIRVLDQKSRDKSLG